MSLRFIKQTNLMKIFIRAFAYGRASNAEITGPKIMDNPIAAAD